MGAWSEDNFGNDNACDWELEESKSVKALLAPAEIIVAVHSSDFSTIPIEGKKWLDKKQGIFRKKPKIELPHIILAKKVVEKIILNSELKELWKKAGEFQNWLKIQNNLILTLAVSNDS